MSDIIPFDSTSGGALMKVPAHAIEVFGADGNIAGRANINQLSYRGKVWRRVVDGEEVVLTRPSQDMPGETEVMPIVSVVILDHNKNRSRAYYPGAFEEGKNAAPVCFSGDGVAPDKSVKEPCAATCASCPQSVKGSKINDSGKATTACAPYKRVAVVPSGGGIAKHPVMLLKLAQTSIWDKDNKVNEAAGWYAYDQYLDMLRARGAKHTAMVETRVKFDPSLAYPKLLFNASRWLAPEETSAAKVRLTESAEDIADILTGSQDRDGVTGVPTSEAAPAAVASAPVTVVDNSAAEAAAAQQAQQKAAADKAEKARKAQEKAAKLAKEAQDAAAEANAAAQDNTGFGGFGDATPATVAHTATAAPAAAVATPVTPTPVLEGGTPVALKSLLEGWDD